MEYLYINNESNYMDMVAHMTHIEISNSIHGSNFTNISTRNGALYEFFWEKSAVEITYEGEKITVEFAGYEDRLRNLIMISSQKDCFNPIKHLKAVLHDD